MLKTGSRREIEKTLDPVPIGRIRNSARDSAQLSSKLVLNFACKGVYATDIKRLMEKMTSRGQLHKNDYGAGKRFIRFILGG